MRQLENWIQSFVDYTDNTEAKDIYRTWVAISTIASCLQRKCYLNWSPSGMLGDIHYPNMYIVLVGPSGARKGTAINPGRELIEGVGVPLSPDQSSRQKLIGKMIEAEATHPDRDGKLITHSSLTILSPEFTVFLGQKQNNTELLAYPV